MIAMSACVRSSVYRLAGVWAQGDRSLPDIHGSRLVRYIKQGAVMITLGILLLIVGFIAKVAILWTIGLVLLVVGLILVALGSAGRAVGGRRHYY